MLLNSYYSKEELGRMNFKSIGSDVLLSRKSSIYFPETISIGSHVRIDDFSILTGNIEIGSYVHIAAYCGLYGSKGITMNDFSGLSAGVLIYSESDDYSGSTLTNPTVPSEFRGSYGGQVIVGRHAIVGARAVILPGVSIGEGCAVGSMSLVTKDLESWNVCVGIPCKPIKARNKSLLDLERRLFESDEKKRCHD